VYDSAAALCGVGVPLPSGVGWYRSAASFFQGNRVLTGPMLLRVLEYGVGNRVLDLYAGVGLFAVALAARGAEVIAVEGDPMSGADLETNARAWQTLEVRCAAVEGGVTDLRAKSQDVVVLDPPRTGMSPQAVAEVLRLQAARVVYVSCDPATLARDAKALLAGGYHLGAIEAFDLFPNTPHIETLCVFDYEG
jgi:23S rRNA (uracil1939-C5)-methyltransferase